MNETPRAVFVSHGGGPLPLLGDPSHREMVSCLKRIAGRFPEPDAIVVVSAHWEEKRPTITAASCPSLIYDYYGFPAESYAIQYPCKGEPDLAKDIHRQLAEQAIESTLDESRGLDHGVFVPLKIMYPEAHIPCVQVSLVDTLDPAEHMAVGRALSTLAERNVLLIGSGFSFHNMKAFFTPETSESRHLNHAFEDWLMTTCCSQGFSEDERSELLLSWGEAEGARFCHPREEHLLPLHVCYGAAQRPCSESFEIKVLNRQSSMYLW
jgi:4,5-DOPA dioxygenase extradiol